MRDIFTLFLHAIVIVIRLGRPGGLRSVVAESVLMRHQVLILNRGRKRAPNLRASDRIIAGLCTLMMRQARILRSAIVLKARAWTTTGIEAEGARQEIRDGHRIRAFIDRSDPTHDVR